MRRRISVLGAAVAAGATMTALLASQGAAAPNASAFTAAERKGRVELHGPGRHDARPKARNRWRNVRALSAGLRRRRRVCLRRPGQRLPECVRRRGDGHRLALCGNCAAELGEVLEGRGPQEGRQRRRFRRNSHRPSDDRSRKRALLLPSRNPGLREALDSLDRRRERQGARQDRRHPGRPRHRREGRRQGSRRSARPRGRSHGAFRWALAPDDTRRAPAHLGCQEFGLDVEGARDGRRQPLDARHARPDLARPAGARRRPLLRERDRRLLRRAAGLRLHGLLPGRDGSRRPLPEGVRQCLLERQGDRLR